MEDRIVLDRKAFEALAAESRVKILKSLKQRRKTLSELSKELGMSVSGTKEHLQNLENAELIIKMDDGHKWKYYELTKKGKEVVGPKEIRVWILLSISSIAFIISIFSLLSLGVAEVQTAPQFAMDEVSGGDAILEADSYASKGVEESAVAATLPAEDNAVGASAPLDDAPPRTAETQGSGSTPISTATQPLPVVSLFVGGISLVAVLLCLAILARNRLS
jgi:DNA-binding transcriptional ArsR family regulator